DEGRAPAHAERARPAARDRADAHPRLCRHGLGRGGGLRVRVRVRPVLHAAVRAEREGGAGEERGVSSTRILVADSLRIFRAVVRALLARESDFTVVEAGALDEVLAVMDDDCPDIALIDLEL